MSTNRASVVKCEPTPVLRPLTRWPCWTCLPLSTVAALLLLNFLPVRAQALPSAAIETAASASSGSPGSESQIKESPGEVEELGRIELLIRDARYSEAENPLRSYLLDHPSSWRAHYDLGYLLFRERGGSTSLEERIKESIAELSRSLQLDVRNADAHKILGLDLTMILRDDLAEVEFKQAVDLNPNSAENHYFLGRCYMGQSDYQGARRELEAAIRIDPAYMKAYDNLGISMDRLGDRQAALMNLKKAAELDEKSQMPSELPYLDLARFYHDDNDLGDALVLALKAVDRNPRSAEALMELGKIYRDQSRWQDAIDALTKALAVNPHSAESYFLLGVAYRAVGKRDASRKAIESYLQYRVKPTTFSESPDGASRP